MDHSKTPKEIRIRDFFYVFRRMKPASLAEYVGQGHLIGKGKILLQLFSRPELPPIILYGPPGIGKTTIAELLARKKGYRNVSLHFTARGVLGIREKEKKLKDVLEEAKSEFNKSGIKTLLLLDEMHRITKEQQAVIFDAIQKRFVTFIGTTYRNPQQGLINKLMEKCKIILLEKHSNESLKKILHNLLADKTRGLGNLPIKIDPAVQDYLCEASNGNARNMIRLLEKDLLRQFLMHKGQGKPGTTLQFNVTVEAIKALVVNRNKGQPGPSHMHVRTV